MKRQAEIIGAFVANETGPVHGVGYDGRHVWVATGDAMRAFDAQSCLQVRMLDVPAHAGTAFDGRYLFQVAEASIHKVDPETGAIVSRIPAPGGGMDSGLAWADGSLWVGQYRDKTIVEIDPDTGAVRRTIRTDRFVTGVSWVDGELWHGYDSDGSGGLAHIDADSGKAITTLAMPETSVSGLESDGGDRFFCGGGDSGMVRIVRRNRG